MKKKKLFVLSVDSLFYEDISWFGDCPNINEIYQRSAVVEKVRSTYPAMTYVAHSTMMTGCHPKTHGIYHNEKVEVQEPYPGWHWYRPELKVGTIFDEAAKSGYTSAVINWPVTGSDQNITYLVPEIWSDKPGGDGRLRFLTVCSPGMEQLYNRYAHLLRWKYQPELDIFGTSCLMDIVRDHEPDLIFLHLSQLDHARHAFGGFSPEARAALIACDGRFGQIVGLLKARNIYADYNFFIMGDHGHLPVEQVFHPNILLVQRGFITLDKEGRISAWKCYIHSAGLSAHVVLNNPEDKGLAKEVEALLTELVADEAYGCERIIGKEEMMEKYHLAGPFSYVIEGRPGTSFGNDCTGPLFKGTDNSDYKISVSAHGHLPEKGPQPIFFGAGPAMRSGVRIPQGNLIDQAPTYAKVLGLTLPDSEGKAICEMIKE